MDFKTLLLVQNDSQVNNHQVVVDTDLWEKYLAQSCRLRGQVFYEDGYIAREELTPDGRLTDEYDRFANHVMVFSGETLVGSNRIIEKKKTDEQGLPIPLRQVFKKLELNGHAEIMDNFLKAVNDEKRNLMEYSRTIISPEFRKSKNEANGLIGLSIYTIGVLFALENLVTDILSSTNSRKDAVKKSVTDKVRAFGFENLKDPYSGKMAETFFFEKFNEYSDPLHIKVADWNPDSLAFFKSQRHLFDAATVIKRRE